MAFIHAFQKELLSFVFTLIAAGIMYLCRSRVNLVWSSPHSFTFLVKKTSDEPAPTSNIYTASLYVTNTGRLPATELEVTLNFPPGDHNVWPERPYEIYQAPSSRWTLKFVNLAPKEHLQIEFLSGNELPGILSVRSKECVGRQIMMTPYRVFPAWVKVVVWSLILLGVSSIIYFIIKLLGIIIPS